MRSERPPGERSWLVQVDRRQEGAHHQVRLFLEQLLPGIAHLDFNLFDLDEALALSQDQGALRDFIPVASFHHHEVRVFQFIGEELIDQFGWLVDLSELEKRS